MHYVCTKCYDEDCSGPLPGTGCGLYVITLVAVCAMASFAVALSRGWAVPGPRGGDRKVEWKVPDEPGEWIAFVLVVCVFPIIAPFVLHALFAHIDRRAVGNPPCPKCGPTTWKIHSGGFGL
jgi:hypothetical protein